MPRTSLPATGGAPLAQPLPRRARSLHFTHYTNPPCKTWWSAGSVPTPGNGRPRGLGRLPGGPAGAPSQQAREASTLPLALT